MHAFGAPGLPPTWTSSVKDLVGCAIGTSRLWFTIGAGIVTEIYFPRVDIPQVRDLGFIVADDAGFWVEVKRLGSYRTIVPHAGVPALEVVHMHARFELRLRIAPDPQRDVLLIEVTLDGDDALRPYALLAPHLGGSGRDNVGEAANHHGRRVLWAEQGPFGLALAAVDATQRDALGASSAGYVGASDGWQDFARNDRMMWRLDSAGPGNIALIGELPRRCTLALALASSRESAATLAMSSLCQRFEDVWASHVDAWHAWQRQFESAPDLPPNVQDELAISAMVLRVHQDKTYPGAMVASLSVPWGDAHDDLGGYHLVWPRDLVESAGALLALGALREARDVLRYLIATQLEAGNWAQNQWLGGKPYWQGSQLDEAAFPVLLAAALAERNALGGIDVSRMVSRALAFVCRSGPATEQDRWEEDAGINAFTVSTCIAALVCGARWLDAAAREWALHIADDWNARIEDWTAVRDTALARALGVSGYYVRIAPPPDARGERHLERILPIKNHRCDPAISADSQIATDFLQLVRLGLREPHDPMVLDTLAVVDAQLKVDTPAGPAWRRFTGDGYGEYADGRPFDGAGVGRAWPLLTGERGHYELAAGRDPLPFIIAMGTMVGRCGLMPEQVWDAAAIRGTSSLEPGQPTGSAMPLVWAHAEFIKLVASRALGRAFDRPEALWQRYAGRRPVPEHALWSPRFPITRIRAGQALWVCLPQRARVHHGHDHWQATGDCETRDSGLGLHVAEVPVRDLAKGHVVDFTIFWIDTDAWDGAEFHIDVA
jgi:glucoamylase